MRHRTRLFLEQLEERTAPATFGNPWPDAHHLTLSFAPDGTGVGTNSSVLFQTLDAIAPPAVCSLCGEGFAGAMHIEDLKDVLTEVGLDWRLHGPVAHYMYVCPRCRRRQVGIWHGQAMTIASTPSPSGRGQE